MPKPDLLGRIFTGGSPCEALGVMTDLWLISVPLDKTSLASVEKLKHTIAKANQASCCKFSIPDLKVRWLFKIRPKEGDCQVKYTEQIYTEGLDMDGFLLLICRTAQ